MFSKSKRRRIVGGMLMIGLVLSLGPLLGVVQDERELVLRLHKPAERITVTWLDGPDALWSGTFYAPSGDVTRALRLAPGTYRVEFSVARNGRTEQTTRRVVIADDATRVVLPIE
jgi:hypothetical protein